MASESIIYGSNEIHVSRADLELCLRLVALNMGSGSKSIESLRNQWFKISRDLECYSIKLDHFSSFPSDKGLVIQALKKIESELEKGEEYFPAELLNLLGLTEVSFTKSYPKKRIRIVAEQFRSLLETV